MNAMNFTVGKNSDYIRKTKAIQKLNSSSFIRIIVLDIIIFFTGVYIGSINYNSIIKDSVFVFIVIVTIIVILFLFSNLFAIFFRRLFKDRRIEYYILLKVLSEEQAGSLNTLTWNFITKSPKQS